MLTNHDDKKGQVVVDENVARNILHLEKIPLGGEGEGVQPGHRAHLHCNHFLCPSLAQVHVLSKFISSFFRVQIVNLKLFHAKKQEWTENTYLCFESFCFTGWHILYRGGMIFFNILNNSVWRSRQTYGANVCIFHRLA